MLDPDRLAALAREHGDAFHLVDTDRFRANLRDLRAAFAAVHPRVSLGWSYKTNLTPALGRIADAEGCHAEVVSRMELDLARRLGVPGSRTILNGPAKGEPDIESALLDGALVNLDSLAEVAAVEAIARRHPESRLRLGLRCAVTLGGGHVTRFGMDPDELRQAAERLRRLPLASLDGLHCHVSGHRSADAFRARAAALVAAARVVFPTAPPAFLDVGGGLFGRLPDELRTQFPGEVPGWDAVAAAVGGVLDEAWPAADGPELIVEPGAAVVADAVSFVCRVVAVKRLQGRAVAMTTGSIQNLKATPNPIRLPLRVVPDPGRASGPAVAGPVDITGYTCMEGDVLLAGHPGPLRVGDLLVFGHVGAYTTAFKPPFIRPAPAMLAMAGPDGDVAVIRREETLDDLLASYALPDEAHA